MSDIYNYQIQVTKFVCLHTTVSTPSQPSIRPTLLLIHFWGGSNQTWGPLIEYLRDEYAIIAPSQRGWGLSSRHKDPRAFRIIDYARDLIAMIQKSQSDQPSLFSNGVVLVGHSMGGKIAQYLITQPQIQSILKGVILIAPAPSGSFQLPGEMKEQQIHAYDSFDSATFVIRNVLLGKLDAVHDQMVKDLAHDAVAGSPEARAAWPAYGMTEDYEKDVVNAVRELGERRGEELRVLVVTSDLDRVETAENVEKRVVRVLGAAGAAVIVESFVNIGHLVLVEASEKLAAAIRRFTAS